MIYFLTFSLIKMEKVSFILFFISFYKKIHSKNKLITCRAIDSTKSNITEVCCRSGFPINQAEEDDEEDCEVPPELAKLLKHEEKVIQSHQK